METEKKILDACCGGRMFWFDKNNQLTLFADKRMETITFKDLDKKRVLDIKPDIQMDFTKMPFRHSTFKLVVFDPPHLNKAGKNSWLAKKYGVLGTDWQTDIKDGINECMRVLEIYGILIFKWNESQIKVTEVLKLVHHKPLFGHTTGRQAKTIWLTFMKTENV